MVKVGVAAGADDLVASLTAAVVVVVVVALDVVFDDVYIVIGFAIDSFVLSSLVVVFVLDVVDDAGVSAVFHNGA